MLEAAWWTAGATIALATLAVATVIMAVLAYRSQDRQLRTLEKQAGEQHAVNIRQIEVFDAQLAELREAPKLRELEAQERRRAEERQAQADERQAQAEERRAEERRQVEEYQATEQRRAQAEKVFLVEDRLDHDPAVSQAQRASGARSGPAVVARVRNDSDKPVYNLTITWHRGSAPWGEFERRKSLMPDAEWASTKALPVNLPGNVDPEVFGAVVWFRDAAGNHWRRRPDGVLDEIPPGQPLP
jgi:hypothetical protein